MTFDKHVPFVLCISIKEYYEFYKNSIKKICKKEKTR